MPVFYRVYLTLLAIFAVLLVIGAFFLNAWLKNYNEGIPETVSQRFFESCFEEADINTLLSYTTVSPERIRNG